MTPLIDFLKKKDQVLDDSRSVSRVDTNYDDNFENAAFERNDE